MLAYSSEGKSAKGQKQVPSCLEILQKDCSECPSFLNKVRLFLSRKPFYYLPCPKFDMQNTSFITEVVSIKSRDTMQNLKWIEEKQFQHGIY